MGSAVCEWSPLIYPAPTYLFDFYSVSFSFTPLSLGAAAHGTPRGLPAGLCLLGSLCSVSNLLNGP